MKKILTMAMAILMVTAMTACGGSKPVSSTPPAAAPAPAPASGSASTAAPTAAPAAKIKTVIDGKLTIATSADFAPYEFHMLGEDGKDKIVGFDIALAEAIAKDMGLELAIKDMSFDAILMEINAGTVDLGVAGFSPDEERKKAVDFSDIYYTGDQSVMIKKADAEKYKALADLNKPELSVAAQTGSIQEKLAKENTPNAKYVGLQAVPNIIMELNAGKVNAVFMETVVAESYAKTQTDLMLMCKVPYDAQGSAVAIKKGNTDLVNAVNATIKKLIADGSIGKFVEEANALSTKAVG